VHLREAVLLDLEADAASGVAVDEVDEVPWDAAGAEAGCDSVDRLLGQAFEEASDGSSHADLNLGDAEGERVTGLRAVFLAVLPDQVYVVDADDLVAMDVDDLLVEQIALEQEIALIVGQGRGFGGLAKLEGAGGGEVEMRDRDQRVAVAAFGRDQLDDDAVNVSSIDRRRYGKLAHMAEGAALSVDYRGAYEGRDARPVIGMLCH